MNDKNKYTYLKGVLLGAGPKAVEDFIGGKLDREEWSAVLSVNALIDEVMSQMPEEELEQYLAKYSSE